MINVTELNLTQLQELISNAQLELNKKINAKSDELKSLKKEWESLFKEINNEIYWSELKKIDVFRQHVFKYLNRKSKQLNKDNFDLLP